MQVIAGSAKGRRLKTVRGLDTRPTADRVRQSIFDVLGPDVHGATVLDLFAGSGALGIEPLERGASEAVFVETGGEACAAIRANLAATGFAGRGTVRRADALRWLAGLRSRPFDLVFLDPPYARGLAFVARILEKLAARGWVRIGGTVVAEAAAGELSLPSGFRETRMLTF